MVWRSITSKGKGILLPVVGSIISQQYCQVLQDGLLLVPDWYFTDGDAVFVKNDAPSHASSETRYWLDQHHIEVNSWPPQRLDLIIVENIWSMMKLEQQKKVEVITSRKELFNSLQ